MAERNQENTLENYLKHRSNYIDGSKLSDAFNDTRKQIRESKVKAARERALEGLKFADPNFNTPADELENNDINNGLQIYTRKSKEDADNYLLENLDSIVDNGLQPKGLEALIPEIMEIPQGREKSDLFKGYQEALLKEDFAKRARENKLADGEIKQYLPMIAEKAAEERAKEIKKDGFSPLLQDIAGKVVGDRIARGNATKDEIEKYLLPFAKELEESAKEYKDSYSDEVYSAVRGVIKNLAMGSAKEHEIAGTLIYQASKIAQQKK